MTKTVGIRKDLAQAKSFRLELYNVNFIRPGYLPAAAATIAFTFST